MSDKIVEIDDRSDVRTHCGRQVEDDAGSFLQVICLAWVCDFPAGFSAHYRNLGLFGLFHQGHYVTTFISSLWFARKGRLKFCDCFQIPVFVKR